MSGEEVVVQLVLVLTDMDHKGTATPHLQVQTIPHPQVTQGQAMHRGLIEFKMTKNARYSKAFKAKYNLICHAKVH